LENRENNLDTGVIRKALPDCPLAGLPLHLPHSIARPKASCPRTGGLVVLAVRQNEGIPVTDLKLPPELRADCSRCAGLCCVVHAFYSDQGFAFDKPAHSACRHLTRENRCGIHAGLAARGFPGCVAFDCCGAGQRVMQEICSGTSWRTSDESAVRELFSAYVSSLALHRLMAMLVLAEATLSPPFDARLRQKREQLNELCASAEARNGSLDIATLRKEILGLVMSVSGRAERLSVMKARDRDCV
jgi:hypothetical protein